MRLCALCGSPKPEESGVRRRPRGGVLIDLDAMFQWRFRAALGPARPWRPCAYLARPQRVGAVIRDAATIAI